MRLSVMCAVWLALGCGQPFFQFTQPKPPPEPLFPRAVRPDEILAISFQRTPCFGFCPTYGFSFQRTGMATYCGRRFVNILGAYEARMDSAAFAALTHFLVKKGFFELRRNYARPVTDQASVIIEVTISDTSKTVVDYGDYGPASLRSIEEELDSIGAHLSWNHVVSQECATT